MPTKTSAGPNEVVRLEVLRLAPPLKKGTRVRALCAVYPGSARGRQIGG
jgi:hypothetical protein